MPAWSAILDELNSIPVAKRDQIFSAKSHECVSEISKICKRNVLCYASSFLQKPELPGITTLINMEDINGFMAGVHGHDFNKGLLLILHTPGGLGEAAQTIVDYLRSKYNEIDVLVPTYAMSAGTMIALGCDRIIMGRQSQLGPTDPQIIVGNRSYSAHSIVEQFDEAKSDIANNPILAHAWAPIINSFAPALLQEARKSISYGRTIVENWLINYMFSSYPEDERSSMAKKAAKFFSGADHGSHGRRIGRDETKKLQLKIIDLEENQNLQEQVLTLYHLLTIGFEQGPATKLVISSNRRMWVKNLEIAKNPNLRNKNRKA